ncbi:hypothetical protein BU15DRAFT_80508 [Melanogaster broomeanus]|nr:hypothetical protein BU15DRAFT_80508 [Melanogaster broomeanus]
MSVTQGAAEGDHLKKLFEGVKGEGDAFSFATAASSAALCPTLPLLSAPSGQLSNCLSTPVHAAALVRLLKAYKTGEAQSVTTDNRRGRVPISSTLFDDQTAIRPSSFSRHEPSMSNPSTPRSSWSAAPAPLTLLEVHVSKPGRMAASLDVGKVAITPQVKCEDIDDRIDVGESSYAIIRLTTASNALELLRMVEGGRLAKGHSRRLGK